MVSLPPLSGSRLKLLKLYYQTGPHYLFLKYFHIIPFQVAFNMRFLSFSLSGPVKNHEGRNGHILLHLAFYALTDNR